MAKYEWKGFWNTDFRWYTDPMNWDPEIRYHLKGTPIFGDWIEAVEGLDFAKRYMDTYGLTWDDIRYVTKLPGTGYGRPAVSTLNYVSRNIARLYR